MAKKHSSLERTLKTLRSDPACIRALKVEHWNHFAKKKQDLLGGDVLALYVGGLRLVQVTDMQHRAAHVRAAQGSVEVRDWLLTGNPFEVWAWRKLKDGKYHVDITAVAEGD